MGRVMSETLAAADRVDSFPYRHRVRDVMSAPLVIVPPDVSLTQAVERMREANCSSVIVESEPLGIITERDLARLVAERGAAALDLKAQDAMTAPVEGVPAAAFVFLALGRMQRLGLRHLLALDEWGEPVGMVTARGLLKQRAGHALMLGDEIAFARTGAELAAVQEQLPALARALLDEQVPALDVAAVISAVLRDLSARAVTLAAEELGPAPAAWCYLVLGSGGRGESLLAADQDNALIHAGEDARDDAWFERLGARASDLLNEAGLPFCKGGSMASKPDWRHDQAAWRKRVDRWVAMAEGEGLLNVDIFYDFVPVAGDAELAEDLRRYAMRAAEAPILPLKLAKQLEGWSSPIGFLGGIKTEEGRVNLKLRGIYPIVAGARAIALKRGFPQTATVERLRQAGEAGVLSPEDAEGLCRAYGLMLDLILDQQLRDIAADRAPTTLVEVKALSRSRLRDLKDALKAAGIMPHAAMGAVM